MVRGDGAQRDADRHARVQVDLPNPEDVLFDRLQAFPSQPGNMHLQTHVNEMLPTFQSTQSRHIRSTIASIVYDRVAAHGRFLRRVHRASAWVVMNPDEAFRAIFQLLMDQSQLAAVAMEESDDEEEED
jgi:hypothetical protein